MITIDLSKEETEFLKHDLKSWEMVQANARFKYGSHDHVYRPLPGVCEKKKVAEALLEKIENLLKEIK